MTRVYYLSNNPRLQAIAPVVDATLKSLMIPGDPRIVQLTLEEHLPLVRVDAGKLQQTLTNVLGNAYKYSPAGGPITLAVRRQSHEGRDGIAIVVTDQGIGMSAEQTRRAFDRFYRADTSGAIPGTGLGLALVKEIIEIHGGCALLSSAPDKGTCITLWLPQSQHA